MGITHKKVVTKPQNPAFEVSKDEWNDTHQGEAAPSATVVTETAYGQSEAAGSSADYSRGDHTHGTPAAPDLTTKLNKTPDYDSAWTAIAADEDITFTHSLGTVELLVDVQAKTDTNIHAHGYGGDIMPSEEFTTILLMGYYWHDLTTTTIKVKRNASDAMLSHVRVRLWKTA